MSREVKRVELPAKIKGEFFVRAINPIEDIDREDALQAAGEDKKRRIAIQLSAFACTSEGEQMYPTAEAALEYMGQASTKTGVVMKVVLAGVKLNNLDDEAIEGAEKN